MFRNPPVLDFLLSINDDLHNLLWGPPMLLLFLVIGYYFSVGTGFFQLKYFSLWMKVTLGSCFRKKNKTSSAHSISQFQALTTALAGTVGTGNIAGVATAITAGGPGAVFWMWISAFLGMMTGYAEKLLGIYFRYQDQNGRFVGGAMIYIERGLHNRALAVLYAFCLVLASFGMGNMTQSNSVAEALYNSFHVSPSITGIVFAIVTGIVILGGISRIGSITEKLVPFMAVFYTLGCIYLLFYYRQQLPGVLTLILKEAFRPAAVGGGVIGYNISTAMRNGIARGVFSNEAGLGSSVIAHAAADVKEPAVQGMWGILEVFLDTIFMCTLTSIVILCYLSSISCSVPSLDGVALTSASFSSALGTFGGHFIAISILFFALASLISWAYYGERAAVYLWGEKVISPYKVTFLVFIFLGAVSRLDLVWSIADTFNGLMAVPNLIALVFLSPVVFKETKRYLESNRSRKNKL
jgi:AGCS family alanine or glycine:cation symporter